MPASAKTFTVVENDAGVPIPLSHAELASLNRQNQIWRLKLRLNRRPFSYDGGALSARDVTGFVNFGDCVVEVVPKFMASSENSDDRWRRCLWAILSRVYSAPFVGTDVPAQVTKSNHLSDLLGMVLLRSLRDCAPNGLPKGYVAEQGRLIHFQGRLDLGRLVDIVRFPGQIPCEYDVYSENVVINRLMRWAAEQLSSLVWSNRLGYELLEAAQMIRADSAFHPSMGEAERVTLSPHHSAMQPALTVAQLLLSGRGLQHGLGDQELPGFLWKSAEVFERFMRYLIQRAVRTRFRGIRLVGDQIRLADPVAKNTRPLRTVPDFRLESSSGAQGVLDAKYKIWQNQPAPSDTYQVITGAWARNCKVAALVYPSLEGKSVDPIEWRLRGPGNPRRLWALFVNLTEMGNQSGEKEITERLTNDLSTIIS